MKKKALKAAALITAALSICSLAGCGTPSYPPMTDFAK